MKIIIIFLFIVFFISINSLSYAKEITVSKNYNTKTLGWMNTSFNTIQQAINNADENDTIILLNETYYENILVNKTIKIKGDKKNTVLNGRSYNDVICIISDNTEISNITVVNSSCSSNTGGINVQSDNIKIVDCIIKDNPWSGIRTGYIINNMTIKNNQINSNGYGVFLNYKNNNCDILKNKIHDNTWDGIYADKTSNLTIYKNNIYENNDDGIGLQNSFYIIILENIIDSNYENGIYTYNSELNILENHIKNQQESGIFLRKTNNTNINKNIIKQNNKGITLILMSANNQIYENTIQNNNIGIYDETTKNNNYDDNEFILNNQDILKIGAGEIPGFEILIFIISVILMSFYKNKKNR